MLLAQQLALVAIDPESGRHSLGTRSQLNACLAGLLIAERSLRPTTGDPDDDALLAAAGEVVAEKDGDVKAALSHMDRGLSQRLGKGTWDSAVDGLVRRGIVAPESGTLRPKNDVLDPAAREAIVTRLRHAAAGDGPIDVDTALVLSLTGPAQLLEVVAPDRKGRKHARRRIDNALDETENANVGEAVRKVLADAQAAVIAATVAATTAATLSS